MFKRGKKLTIALVVVGIAVYLLAVFPTRSYLLQRSQVRNTIAQVRAVESSNQTLQKKIDSMNSPSQIEQIARSHYGLIKPGEKAYVVLPPKDSTTTTTLAQSKK